MYRYLTTSLLFLLVLFSCKKKETKSYGIKLTADTVPVSVVSADTVTFFYKRSYTGKVSGIHQLTLLSKVNDLVDRVLVGVEDKVNKGDLLVRMDEYGTSSSLRQSRAQFELAEKNFERMQELYNDGAISRQQFDIARNDFLVSRANYIESAAAISVFSPLEGVVTAIYISEGQLLGVGDPLLLISKSDSLEILSYVNSRDVLGVKLGDTVQIQSDNVPNVRQRGKVVEIFRSADNANTFQVKIHRSNTKPEAFLPNSFCKVIFNFHSPPQALAVPSHAIFEEQAYKAVYVADGGRAKIVRVKTGASNDSLTAVTQGLKAGDRIVVKGISSLRANSFVKIVNSDSL